MIFPRRGRGRAAGIAIQQDRVFVAPAGPAGVWSRPLDPPTDSGWPDLRRALSELRTELGTPLLRARVALLAPLVETRKLVFPPLRQEELLHVLRRDASRYFLSAAPVPHAVAVLRRRSGDPGMSVLAAAVPVRVLDAVATELRRAEVRVDRIAPAHFLWETAATRMAPRRARRVRMLIPRGERIEQVDLVRGRIVALRWHADAARALEALRGQGASSEGPLVADSGATPSAAPAVVVLGTEELPPEVLAELGLEHGDTEGRPPAGAVAASLVSRVRLPEFRAAADAKRVAASARRVARTQFGIALALLLLAGKLILWGLDRELTAVEGERSRVAAAAGAAFESERALLSLRALTNSVAALQTGEVAWTAVVAGLGRDLPEDAYLLSLEGTRDSVVLEGLAKDAAVVERAFRGAPGVLEPRFLVPVRRQPATAGTPLQRFRLAVNRVDGASGYRKEKNAAERRP